MVSPFRLACVLAGLGLLGCSPDVQDGVGPRLALPNVTGLSLRAGQPADNLDVELRDAETAATVDVTVSQGGHFAFAEVAAGTWEIRVSGSDTGDFDVVSRVFALDDPDSLLTLLDFEVWAFGCAALAPPAGATLPRPSLFTPLTFRWAAPVGAARELDWARVYVYTAEGEQVWTSERIDTTEQVWNGVGSEDAYAGLPIPAGAYYWRLKISFTDGLEARTARQDLVFE